MKISDLRGGWAFRHATGVFISSNARKNGRVLCFHLGKGYPKQFRVDMEVERVFIRHVVVGTEEETLVDLDKKGIE